MEQIIEKKSCSYERKLLFSFNVSLLLPVKNQVNKYTDIIMEVHLGHEFQFIFKRTKHYKISCSKFKIFFITPKLLKFGQNNFTNLNLL